MKILLVNHYAGHPDLGMEYRPFYMAREWKKRGHQVEVVACSESHLRHQKIALKSWKSHEKLDGIDYTWIRSLKYNGNGAMRFFNMLLFTCRLWLYGRFFKADKPDVVIASSTHPLDLYPCGWLARRWKAQFIYEVHDLWPLSPIELGNISPKHPLMQLFQHAENFGYRRCDSVVSILPCTLEHMKSHGLAEDKFHHIPNGVFPGQWNLDIDLPPQHAELISSLKSTGKKLLDYAGAHGVANDLASLLQAAQNLPKDIAVILLGNGPEKENLQVLAIQLELENVHFLPAISKEQIPAFLQKMDALYIGLAPQPLFRFGVSPNKLMDYMMAGKPILYAIDSGNHPVKDFECGLETTPGNPEKISQTLAQLFSLPLETREAMGKNAQRAVKKYFDYKNLAENFLQVMEGGGSSNLQKTDKSVPHL